MLHPLPMGDLCSGKTGEPGCGKCCQTIGMPPFQVPNPEICQQTRSDWYIPIYESYFGHCDFTNNPYTTLLYNPALRQRLIDTEIMASMPRTLRLEHAIDLLWLTEDPTKTPCTWLDPVTNRCKHYEYRPAACRDWIPGGAGCRSALEGGVIIAWRNRGETEPDQWRNPYLALLQPTPGTPHATTALPKELIPG